MEDIEFMKREKKEDFVVEMLRRHSEATGDYIYSVARFSEVAYLQTLEQKIYLTLKGAENKFNEWVRIHITN